MKNYINFNTEERTNATNGFFKLMINTAYGKTMANLRNRIMPD